MLGVLECIFLILSVSTLAFKMVFVNLKPGLIF